MRSLTQDCTLNTQLIWTHAPSFCGLSMSGYSLLWNHIGHRLWIEGGFLCESQEVLCFQSILSTGHILSSPGVQPFNIDINIFVQKNKRNCTCICFSLSQKILVSRCPFKPSSSPINVSWLYTNSIQLPLLMSLPGCKTGTLSQLHSKSVTLWIHKCFSSNAFFPFLSLLVSNFSIFL